MERLSSGLTLVVALLSIATVASCDDARDYYADGVVKGKKSDYEGAVSDLDKAINLNPNLAVAYFARGLAKQSKHDLEHAIDDYTKAIELKPDYFQAYDSRGIVNAAQGDLDGH